MRLPVLAAAAVLLSATSALAGGLFDKPEEVGLPTDPAKLAIECSAHIIILKGWADEGQATGFDTADIVAAGQAWVPIVYKNYRASGAGDGAAENAVADRMEAIEEELRGGKSYVVQAFARRSTFCVRHAPA